jgi:release factor glutamine methyltransferase
MTPALDPTEAPGDTIAHALLRAQRMGLPRPETEYLLLHLLDKDVTHRAWLRAHDTDVLATDTSDAFQALCTRRLAGEPIAYLTGRKAFYGLDLTVDARVLDPRPDTECLVDWALDVLPRPSPDNPRPIRFADLGTGSGAIALAVASQRPDVLVWAVDASADALAVATHNAQRLQLPVTLLLGSWLQPLLEQSIRVDVLVSNPPYIREDDPHLPALVHEPRQALVSGADGLDDIRHIVTHAPEVLEPGGWLLFEHGHDQADAVAQLLAQRGFASVQSRKDLAGHLRCTGGQWPRAAKP